MSAVRMGAGSWEHFHESVNEDRLETVGLHRGSQVETHDTDGRRIQRGSSDEGIGLSCGDTDVVEGRRHLRRERHQPVGLTKRPS